MTQEKNKQTALWTKIALAGLIATLPLQLAKADTIVAPAGFENVEGGADNSYPIGNSGINAVPYQQIFDASLFGSSPILISSFAFRADDIMPLASGNIIDLASLQVTMSTTSKLVDGLDTTIANNLGIDATMVINDTGGRKLSSDLSKDENGITYDFDYIFAFDAPFLYDPDQGNLIFQIDATYGPASWITVFDAHGTIDGTSRVYTNDGGSSFNLSTLGLVTQFTFQPVSQASEPSLLGLLGLGLVGAGLIYQRRKK